MFNAFVSTCAVAFITTHRQNKARRFDTEGFVPVDNLCGVVGSPSLFTIFGLIGQEIYDKSCTLMQSVYICQKPVRAP